MSGAWPNGAKECAVCGLDASPFETAECSVVCPECESVHFERLATRDQHNEWTAAKSWEVRDGRTHLLRSLASLVAKHRPNGGKILDVGCSVGKFLDCLPNTVWEKTGLDPSSCAIDQARMTTVASWLVSTMEDVDLPENYYDVVTILDAIYYSSAPRVLLEKAVRVLKPGGLLVVEMPNKAYVLRRRVGWVRTLVDSPESRRLRFDDAQTCLPSTVGILSVLLRSRCSIDALQPLGPPLRRSPITRRGSAVLGAALTLAYRATQGVVDACPKLVIVAVKPSGCRLPRDEMGIDYRAARTSDLPAVARLHEVCFPPPDRGSVASVIEAWYSHVLGQGVDVTVASRAKGGVVGFAEVRWRGGGTVVKRIRALDRPPGLYSLADRGFASLVKGRYTRQENCAGVELRAVGTEPALRSAGIGSNLIGLASRAACARAPKIHAWVSLANTASVIGFMQNGYVLRRVRVTPHEHEGLFVKVSSSGVA